VVLAVSPLLRVLSPKPRDSVDSDPHFLRMMSYLKRESILTRRVVLRVRPIRKRPDALYTSSIQPFLLPLVFLIRS